MPSHRKVYPIPLISQTPIENDSYFSAGWSATTGQNGF